MQCACAILSSVAYPALQYFSTLSHNGYEFREKKFRNIKCVFLFSLKLLSKTFLILRKSERDTIIDVQRSSIEVPRILARF